MIESGVGGLMRLSPGDFETIRAYIAFAKERLESEGLTFRVSLDMREFKNFLLEQPNTHGVPPTHDPDRCVLTEANSFWSYLETEDGRRIACNAQRLFLTDDFIEACQTQTAFMDRMPVIDQTPADITREAAGLDIRGRLDIGGGTWIHPDWRGRELLVYARMSRAVALRHWLWDWIVGFAFNTPNRRAMALTGMGYSRAVPFINGHYPPHGPEQHRDIQLTFGHRDEFMSQLRDELDRRAVAA